MDESTPHLHIDFVPFTTGSKRGLETRVSLKQSLAAQGFTGGTRTETEWNQWIQSEKEELALVMERYGVEWEQKGTHEKHLTVLEYEKKMRAQEVVELDNLIDQKQTTAKSLDQQIEDLSKGEEFIVATIERFDNAPEWQLPEPSGLMTAKSYMQKLVIPFVNKLKNFARKALTLYYRAVSDIADRDRTIRSLRSNYWSAKEFAYWAQEENQKLRSDLKNYGILRKFLGPAKTDELIQQAKDTEVAKRQRRNYDRER